MFCDEQQGRDLCWMHGPAGFGDQVLGDGDAVLGVANGDLVILLALLVFTIHSRLGATLFTLPPDERAWCANMDR